MAIKEYKVESIKGINKCLIKENGEFEIKHFPRGALIELDDAEVEKSLHDLVLPKSGVWTIPEAETEQETPRQSTAKK